MESKITRADATNTAGNSFANLIDEFNIDNARVAVSSQSQYNFEVYNFETFTKMFILFFNFC